MLKNKKIISSIFISLFSVLLSCNISSAAPNTVTIAKGSPNNYPKYIRNSKNNSRQYTTKIESGTNRAAYCIDQAANPPVGEKVTQYTDSKVKKNDKGLQYILKNGLQYYDKNKASSNSYMTGNIEKDYYITQAAIQLYLDYYRGDSRQDSDWMMSDSTVGTLTLNNSTNKDVLNRVRKLATDANAAYNKSISTKTEAKSNQPRALTVSPSSMEFSLKGNYYESNNFTVNTSASKYTVQLTGISSTYYRLVTSDGTVRSNGVFNKGEKFKIQVNKNTPYGTYSLKISLSASESNEAISAFTYKSSSGTQAVIVPYEDGYTISESASVSGKLTTCNTSPLEGTWKQNKKFTISGYNVKKDNKQVGTLKIGESYDLNTLLKYDYSTTWQAAKSSSKTINTGKFNDIITKYKTIKSDESTISTSNQDCEPCSLDNDTSNNKQSNSTSKQIKNTTKNVTSRAIVCPQRPYPAKPNAGCHSGNVSYTIKYIDEHEKVQKTDTGSVATGDYCISGNPADGTLTKFVKNSIELKVPNKKGLVEAQITLKIENSTYKITLPIEYEFDLDYAVSEVVTNMDSSGSSLYEGQEITVQGTITSTGIKSENLKTQLQVSLDGGAYKAVETQYAYSVSRDLSGNVYYLYKVPENTDKVQFKIAIILESSNAKETASNATKNNSKTSKSFNVIEPNAKDFNYSTKKASKKHNSGEGYTVAYLKVKKTDKTKAIYKQCTGCQVSTESSAKECPAPGHIEYTWEDTSYPAFYPKSQQSLDGMNETLKITSIKYKSKYTTEKAGTNPVDRNGYVDIMEIGDSDIEKYIKVKSGYGFEVKIETEYTNDVPKLVNNINKTNNVSSISNKVTDWAKIQAYSGSTSKLFYKDIDKNLGSYLKNSTPIMFIKPAVDELPVESINQIYMKMPNGSYLSRGDNKGFDIINSNGQTLTLANRNDKNYGKTINDTKITIKKSFTFNSTNGLRKYYLSQSTRNELYDTKIFTHPMGIRTGNKVSNMVRDFKEFKINVYGGYTDDLKTQLND